MTSAPLPAPARSQRPLPRRGRGRAGFWRWPFAVLLLVASVVGVNTFDPEEAAAHTVPATATCPAGYSRVGTSSTCERYVPATAICPAGYSRVGTTSTCERFTNAVETPGPCPAGYTYSSFLGTCFRTQTTGRTCPGGYSYRSATDDCHRPADAYAKPDDGTACRAGYSYDRGLEVCIRPSSTTGASCPAGYSNQGNGRCARTQTAPRGESTYSCTSGTLTGTQCRHTDSVTYSCSSGTLSGTRCRFTASVTYSCPGEHTRSGTSCVDDDDDGGGDPPDPDDPPEFVGLASTGSIVAGNTYTDPFSVINTDAAPSISGTGCTRSGSLSGSVWSGSLVVTRSDAGTRTCIVTVTSGGVTISRRPIITFLAADAPQFVGLASTGTAAAGDTYTDPFTVANATAAPTISGAGCTRSGGFPSAGLWSGTLTVTRSDAGTRTCTLTAGSTTATVTVTFTAADAPQFVGLATAGDGTAGDVYSDPFTVTSATAAPTISGAGCTRSGGFPSAGLWSGTLTVFRSDAGTRTCTLTAGSTTATVTVTFTDLSFVGLDATGAAAAGDVYTDPFTVAGIAAPAVTGTGCTVSGGFASAGLWSGTLTVTHATAGTRTCVIVAGSATATATVTFTAAAPPAFVGLDATGAATAGDGYSDLFVVVRGAPSVTGTGCTLATGFRSAGLWSGTLTVTRSTAGTRTCVLTAGSATATVTVTFTAAAPAAFVGLARSAFPAGDAYSDPFTVTNANTAPSVTGTGCTVSGGFRSAGLWAGTLTISNPGGDGSRTCALTAGSATATVSVLFDPEPGPVFVGLAATGTGPAGDTYTDPFSITSATSAPSVTGTGCTVSGGFRAAGLWAGTLTVTRAAAGDRICALTATSPHGTANSTVTVTFTAAALPEFVGLALTGSATVDDPYSDSFTVTNTTASPVVTGAGCTIAGGFRSAGLWSGTLTATNVIAGDRTCVVAVSLGGGLPLSATVTVTFTAAAAATAPVFVGLAATGSATVGEVYSDPFSVANAGTAPPTVSGTGCYLAGGFRTAGVWAGTLTSSRADAGDRTCTLTAGSTAATVTVTFTVAAAGTTAFVGLDATGAATAGDVYTDPFTVVNALHGAPTVTGAGCNISGGFRAAGLWSGALTVTRSDNGERSCVVAVGLGGGFPLTSTVTVTFAGPHFVGLALTGTAATGEVYTDPFTVANATARPNVANPGCALAGGFISAGLWSGTLTVTSDIAGTRTCAVIQGTATAEVTVTFTGDAVSLSGLERTVTVIVGRTYTDRFQAEATATLSDDSPAICTVTYIATAPNRYLVHELTVIATAPGSFTCTVVAGGAEFTVTITARAAVTGTLATLANSYRCTNTDTGPEVAYTAGDTRLAFRLEYGLLVATWTADVPTVVTGWALWLRDSANTDDVDVYGFPIDIGAGTAATTTSTTWRASEADTGLPNAFVGIGCVDLDPLGVEFLPSALANLIAPLLGPDGYWDGTFTWATTPPTVDLCLDRRIPNAAGSAWGSSFAVDTGGNVLFTASCVFPTGAGGALWIALVDDDGVALGFQFQLIARASALPTEAKFQALGKVWLQFGTSDTSGGSIEVDMAEGCLDYEAGDTACAVLVTADIDGGVSSRIIGHQLRSVKRGAAPDVPEAFAPLVRNEDEEPGEAPELPEITIPGDPEAGEGPSFAEAWAMASQRFDECIATFRGWEVGDLYDPDTTPVTWNPLSWGRWIAQTSADAVVGAISRLGTLVIGGAWVVICAIYAFIFGTPAGVLNIASRIGSGQCAAPPAVPSRIVDGERVTPMLQTTWIDADNDGAIDAGELHSGYEGRSTTCLGVALMAWPVESLRRASGDDYGPVQSDDTEPMSAAVCAAAGHVDQGCPPPCGGPVLPVGTVTGGVMASVIDSSVWIDANNDGIRDPDEVTTNPDPDPFTAPTTTVINGVTYQDVNGYRMRWTGTDAGYSPDQTSLNLSYLSVCSPGDDNPRRALADGVRPWAERILLVVFLLWFLRILWRFVKLFDLTSPTDHRSLQNDLDP